MLLFYFYGLHSSYKLEKCVVLIVWKVLMTSKSAHFTEVNPEDSSSFDSISFCVWLTHALLAFFHLMLHKTSRGQDLLSGWPRYQSFPRRSNSVVNCFEWVGREWLSSSYLLVMLQLFIFSSWVFQGCSNLS